MHSNWCPEIYRSIFIDRINDDRIRVAPCCQAESEIDQVYHWFDQNIKTNREGDVSDFCWQLAGNFDPSALSRIIKMQAIAQLKPIAELAGLVTYVESTLYCPENNQWTVALDKIDAKRNTNWRTALSASHFIKESHC